jgi:2-polyprenyl-6-methoxyphenol hydroxylase-like FAD-dependent oxidoreductase
MRSNVHSFIVTRQVYCIPTHTQKFERTIESKNMTNNKEEQEPAQFVISGAGIVGLVLALALKKHLGVTAEVYEKAHEFADDVGAALGMYPNGMRVLRDIDPKLMQEIRSQGYPYVYRRWERHDGTEIATASEEELSNGDSDLNSIGIRRWRLQKVLYEAAIAAGIKIHFSKATRDVIERDDDLIEVIFEDGTKILTQVLFGVDGGKSAVRKIVAGCSAQLKYTGVTCLMGISDCPSQRQGINFPSSTVSQFHATYFPTGENEQCFQIHFPIDEHDADKSNWGNLSPANGKEEFERLAEQMRKDGWHERYIEPLYRVDHAVRVGFALLNSRLDHWVYGKTRRIVLVGDAAHPPVPYVGQGAQMGVEDAGTLVLLLKSLCMGRDGTIQLEKFGDVMKIYERLRIPRTSKILDCSKTLGELQARRSNEEDARLRELFIEGEVMMNGTLPVMIPGATYNYQMGVMDAVAEERSNQDDKQEFNELMLQAELMFNECEALS